VTFPDRRIMANKLLSALDRALSRFEEWTLCIAVWLALIGLFANVVLRYGFNYTLAWSEELVREVIIYTTFIGCSAAVRSRSLIKVDAAFQLFPRLRGALTRVSHLSVLVFALMMIWYGVQLAAMQVASGQKTVILEIPTVYLYAIMPLMGVMMTIRVVQALVRDRAHADAVD
jgi:TRAP-type C4-dicarboxylate transport system permease small subunit